MRAWLAVAITVLAASMWIGCPDSPDALCSNNFCASDAADSSVVDGGRDARSDGSVHHDASRDGRADHLAPETGTSDAPADSPNDAGCDVTKDPKDEPCLVSDTYGVFVAPATSGAGDAGSGTKASPYATITQGITNAHGQRVYVCGATYPEALNVTASVSVYGGFACPGSDAGASWAWTGATVLVAPSAPGYALDVESSSGVTFEDMSFAAQPAATGSTGAAASSIAVMVNGSMGVSFVRVIASAGTGVHGPAGSAWTESNWCGAGPAPAGNAAATTGGTGGPSTLCTCGVLTADNSQGGPGGNAFSTGTTGTTGAATPPAAASGARTGAGGTWTTTNLCGDGHPGANGAAGDGGAAGGAGALSSSGWSSVPAAPGGTGNPGQGGGGGGGASDIGGAGGGAGGCGGSGGSGGGGGGGSIAIAVVNSQVRCSSVTLTTLSGGAGGIGGAGQPGQAGGTKGVDPVTSDGCNGGAGGAGAGGGGGGGGGGGPSLGIGWSGTSTITVDDAGLTDAGSLTTPSQFNGAAAASGGGGGPGGEAGGPDASAGATGNAGPDGLTNAVRGL